MPTFTIAKRELGTNGSKQILKLELHTGHNPYVKFIQTDIINGEVTSRESIVIFANELYATAKRLMMARWLFNNP